jgi:hypothetical protein
MFNEQFAEMVAPIGKVGNNSFSTPQNSGWINVSDYSRIAILINALAIGTNLAVQVDLATDAAGSNLITNWRHLTTLTSVPAQPSIIEIIATELGYPTGGTPATPTGTNYSYIRVVATPSGTVAAGILILGCAPRQAAVDPALWNQIVAFVDT